MLLNYVLYSVTIGGEGLGDRTELVAATTPVAALRQGEVLASAEPREGGAYVRSFGRHHPLDAIVSGGPAAKLWRVDFLERAWIIVAPSLGAAVQHAEAHGEGEAREAGRYAVEGLCEVVIAPWPGAARGPATPEDDATFESESGETPRWVDPETPS